MKQLLRNQKIFGVGLSKTGTTSLGHALELLGIETVHYPYDERTYEELTHSKYKLSILNTCQAIVDITVAPYYEQLDRAHPKSKFILTIRDKDAWLNSVEKHWERIQSCLERDHKFSRFTRFITASTYGTWTFEPGRFSYVYDVHTKNVKDYFEGRCEDLLIMDICGGQGWNLLCPFLGIPVPPNLFPHFNRAPSDAAQRTLSKRFDDLRDILSEVIPSGDAFILVDQQSFRHLLDSGWQALPFLERDGVYWGNPSSGEEAISELERLRSSGARFIAFAWPAFWWFDYYEAFQDHLRSHYRCAAQTDQVVVFDLR